MRYAIMGTTLEQVKNVGGVNIKESPRTGIIFANLTPEQANRLIAMGCQVTEVGEVKATVMPPIPIAAAPVFTTEALLEITKFEQLRSMMKPALYGSGFNIAFIDSGIRETHEKVMNRVVYRKNYTSDPMEDGYNHGTGTCSIAVAVAPLCNVLNLKVLDSKGEGSEEEVVLAIDDCISLHDTQPDIAPSVINLSLGGPDDGNPNNPLRVACRAAIDKGIWVVAAAGNGGPALGTIMSPACERYVGAIGSLSYEPFQVSNFSSRGPTKEGLVKPDTTTFGENIVMASNESDTATIAKSGTSFAAPFHSGVALIFQEAIMRYGGVRYIGEAPLGVPLTEIIAEKVSVQDVLDVYLPDVCIKPEGLAAGKDNDCGYGLPFGTLVAQVAGITPAVSITDVISPMMGMVVLGMFGMMMIPMAKSLWRR